MRSNQKTTPKPKNDTMDLDEKKEDIDVDAILEEEAYNNSKKKVINLDDSKKKKEKVYDIDDTILRDITLAGDIHVRLISNINGYFIDIRKYFRGFPSKKGIRMLASKFSIAADYLKKDLTELVNK